MHDRSSRGPRPGALGTGTRDILAKGRDWIVNEMKASGCGAGRARAFRRAQVGLHAKESDGGPSYLVVNADESEPGTCKDREIMRHDPHTPVEGCLIASFAMGAHACYIYIRGEYVREKESLQRAVDEAYDAGCWAERLRLGLGLRPLRPSRGGRLYLRRGDGASGKPRGQEGDAAHEAAFPGGGGLYGCPTTVNNVESIAVVPTILRRGASWFSSFGRPNNRGTKIFAISGHVNRPCVVEESMSIPFVELIDKHCGGIRGGWDNLKAVIPGGSSVPNIKADVMMDAIMDFDWLREQKSGLGTAAVIVMDQSTDMVKAIWRLAKFYKHESCGQCTPCREGTGWMMRVMERLVTGEAEVEEIDMLLDVTKQVEGHTICALGDAAAWPIQGLIRNFRDEIEDRIRAKKTGRVTALAAE
jgi:NADH-quinone oxidoreductase subunit F